MEYSKLINKLQEVFLKQADYFFDKHVPEFIKDGNFLGDYFNQIAVEPLGEKPPRFYHTFSPFDVISNKSPHYAVVFENGEQLLNIEFDRYVSMRTAAMNAVLLKVLGINDLSKKKVLIFGSGKIATEAVKILASEFSLKEIDVISKSGDLTKLTNSIKNVSIKSGNVDNLSGYDLIICHTKTEKPLISEKNIQNIKHGAILTSFISSTEHGEFAEEIYDETRANIITDWDKTILGAKDLQRAQEKGLFIEPMYLQDLLNKQTIDNNKQYTVYRSTGTPIQNLAVLKLLLEK
ncbi:MAG: hypothetical protein KA007_03060 [Candidatus Pacebacteria bacterium]|jgi:ornithine cyclodeaminase/alanine dehydrogenase-like protein (mu-crystallin family)|nr:hypothetical protein [Candidatus Paceibacterota bacterium]